MPWKISIVKIPKHIHAVAKVEACQLAIVMENIRHQYCRRIYVMDKSGVNSADKPMSWQKSNVKSVSKWLICCSEEKIRKGNLCHVKKASVNRASKSMTWTKLGAGSASKSMT